MHSLYENSYFELEKHSVNSFFALQPMILTDMKAISIVKIYYLIKIRLATNKKI
jgi:hypothetical protein